MATLLVLVAGMGALAAQSNPPVASLKSSELFSTAKIWTVHLQFTPEAWTTMEPKGGQGGLGALFGGGAAPSAAPRGGDFLRGLGAGGGAPGGAMPGAAGGAGGGAGLVVGLFLTPTFVREADGNKDAAINQGEFRAIGVKWFGQWDSGKSGSINSEKLNAGLNQVFSMQSLFGGAGPGGPGGGGVLGGFTLQGSDGTRNGLASRLGLEFEYVRATLDFAGTEFKDIGARYKGNGTFVEARGTLKRPLKLDLNRNVKGQKLAGVTTLNLHNNVADPGWMNEALSYEMFREAGVPSPRTAYTKVYVTVPGQFDRQYLGLYTLVENIDKNFIREHLGTNGGALFKPSTPSLFADLGNDWEKYQQTYDPKDEVSEKATRRVMDFSKLVTSASDADFAAKVADYVDLDEFARFVAVTVSLSALDSILAVGQNYYLYLDPMTERFKFLPWDQDHSFGQLFGTQAERENLSIHQPWQGSNRFLERMFAVPAFKQLYLRRLGEFASASFLPEKLAKQIDELAALIRPAIREESEQKLARFETSTAGQAPPAANAFGGTQGAKPIKAFMPIRSRSIQDQLAGRAQGAVVAGGMFGGFGNRGAVGAPAPGGAQPAAAPTPGFGMMLSPGFMTALDADKSGAITQAEFTQGFERWFESWDKDKNGSLNADEITSGLGASLPAGMGSGRGGLAPPGIQPQ